MLPDHRIFTLSSPPGDEPQEYRSASKSNADGQGLPSALTSAFNRLTGKDVSQQG